MLLPLDGLTTDKFCLYWQAKLCEIMCTKLVCVQELCVAN